MPNDIYASSMLQGKLAVVAGASSGVNLEIARALARAGARLVLISRTQDRIDLAAKSVVDAGGAAIGVAADVREYDRLCDVITDALEEYGTQSIDIVVSGAAGNFLSPAHLLSPRGFKSVVDIDLVGTFNVLRASYAFLSKPGASLISISAPQACIPYPMQAHVSAAKAGVEMLTRSLALEWGPEGIRVNAIVPGPIAGTEGMSRLSPTEEARDLITASVPLRRYGLASEVADLALFLVSPAAQYVTGAIIPCDGGISLMGPDAFGRSCATQPTAAA